MRPMNVQTRKKIERLSENEWYSKFRTDIRRSGAENLLYGAGVLIYEEDKPDFKTFLSILSKPNYTDTFLWKLICERGVYYPRKTLMTDGTAYDNRMQGVLFTQSGWYAIYNTLGRFSKWFATTEEYNKGRFSKTMRETAAYKGNPSSSIVFSVGRGMVAAMVSGYTYGHNRRGKLPDFIKRNNRSEYYMTVEQMKLVYERIYLMELNSGGIYSLNWLISAQEKSKEEELRKMVAENPGAFNIGHTAGGNLALVETATGREVLIQQAYDLISLYTRRRQANEVTVIGPSWMAEATSKCLNRNLARYISLNTGLEVPFSRYDNNGNKIIPEKDLKTLD